MSTSCENDTSSSVNSSNTSSAASVQPAFHDFLRFVLGWKNSAGYVVTPDQRRKAAPEGTVHVPAALCGKVQT